MLPLTTTGSARGSTHTTAPASDTGARLNVGDLAPAFELDNQDGQLVRSDDLLAHGALVITFFRGHW